MSGVAIGELEDKLKFQDQFQANLEEEPSASPSCLSCAVLTKCRKCFLSPGSGLCGSFTGILVKVRPHFHLARIQNSIPMDIS